MRIIPGSYAAAAVRDARTRGLTVEQIADQLGGEYSLSAIHRACGDIPPKFQRPGRRGADPKVKAEVIAAWRSGRTYREIAKAFGVANATVWKWTKRRAA